MESRFGQGRSVVVLACGSSYCVDVCSTTPRASCRGCQLSGPSSHWKCRGRIDRRRCASGHRRQLQRARLQAAAATSRHPPIRVARGPKPLQLQRPATPLRSPTRRRRPGSNSELTPVLWMGPLLGGLKRTGRGCRMPIFPTCMPSTLFPVATSWVSFGDS